jgi:hypothetical protein
LAKTSSFGKIHSATLMLARDKNMDAKQLIVLSASVIASSWVVA